MLKILLAAAVLTASGAVVAQTCDVIYTIESETADGFDVGSGATTIRALPMADVLDNHAKGLKVIDEASKQQDKGGPYTIELGEFRACDGDVSVKVADGSILVKGVTLAGSNKISRMALKQADPVIKRYEDRAAKGDKVGWDHKKAKKVKRDDLGNKKKD